MAVLIADVASQRLATSWGQLGAVGLSTVLIFFAAILLTRIVGLRSFSKMSAFDFVMTVAVGSLVATAAVTQASLVDSLVGLALLFGLQWGIAVARRRIPAAASVVDNRPQLLVLEGEVLEEALASTHLTRDDLRAKLREANVLRWADVRAVVLETTGDVTVLHGQEPLDPQMLRGVRGAASLEGG